MGRRRDRLDKRLARAQQTRRENSERKAAERLRRDASIMAILSQGQVPYTPGVMSWLSDKLGKKASRITQEDVQSILVEK